MSKKEVEEVIKEEVKNEPKEVIKEEVKKEPEVKEAAKAKGVAKLG